MIKIEDPCLTATLTIDENDTVFATMPAVTLTQFLNYSPVTISWDDSIIASNPVTVVQPCGAFNYELYQMNDQGQEISLDLEVFPSNDLSSATKTLNIATTESSKLKLYTLRM